MTAPERDTLAAEIAGVLGEHVECSIGFTAPSAEGTGLDVWSCGIRAPFRATLEEAGCAHLADALADLLAARERRVAAEVLREGYETARGDLTSGAFIGGPTYEALKASFTGRRIAKEALREAAEALYRESDYMADDSIAWLRDRADRIEADA